MRKLALYISMTIPLMAGGNESDGTKVSLYSDFATGKPYGYQFFSDGRIRNLIGTIRLKSEVRK